MVLKPYIDTQELSIFIETASSLEIPESFLETLSLNTQKRFHQIKSQARSKEFLATRYLLSLIFPESEILSDDNGAPIWPKGLSGSISHKDGIIAIARAKEPSSNIGIDIEKDTISLKLAHRVAPNEDLASLSSASGFEIERVLSLCFSAKESIYKAVHCSLTDPISFHHVCLEEITPEGELIFSTAHRASILATRPKITVKFTKLNIDNQLLTLTYLNI